MAARKTPGLPEIVCDFMQRLGLAGSGRRVLVAVSGGPDSVALLHLLYHLKQALDIKILVAHLDHGLRGDESAADALHVAELAGELGLPFAIGGRDVEGYRVQHGLTLEEAAREVRYNYLCEVAAESGVAIVATGHTRNDNVETILMHLVRGTGTLGLRGLPARTPWLYHGHRIEIVRPLLDAGRDQIEVYCRQHGLKTRLDSTNLATGPLRNRIRLQLLPLLRQYNPAIERSLLRLADIASQELDFLSTARDREWRRVVSIRQGTFVLQKKAFKALHPALKRSILRRVLNEAAGSLKDIEACHIEDILACLDRPAGKKVVLPQGLNFTVEYDRYLLGRDPQELCPYPVIAGQAALKVPGQTVTGGWKVVTTVIDGNRLPPDSGAFVTYLDHDLAGRELYLRTRKDGDRFVPLGLGCEKKVKDFLIDARVPQSWRFRIPVIVFTGTDIVAGRLSHR
jgi:tRNA(Ile)-lysidine synthase